MYARQAQAFRTCLPLKIQWVNFDSCASPNEKIIVCLFITSLVFVRELIELLILFNYLASRIVNTLNVPTNILNCIIINDYYYIMLYFKERNVPIYSKFVQNSLSTNYYQ